MPNGMPEPRHEFFGYLDTVVDFQKRVIANMEQVARRLDDQGAELRTITRSLATLRDDRIATDRKLNDIFTALSGLSARIDSIEIEMRERFGAVGLRFEDLEKSLDQLSKDLHDARSEIILQNNQTLNAIQSAFLSKRQVDDLPDRLAALETKLYGPGET